MSSEKFRKFLEVQATRSPLKISEDKISWEEKGERTVASQASDFLESVYLGKELQNTVVMERSVAAMLQQRLTEIERENEHLRKSYKILRIVLGGVIVAVILMLLTLLSFH